MASAWNEQNGRRRRRSATAMLAAVPVLCLGLAACSSPFKGERDESQPPREQSGREPGYSNADMPTQEDMDREDPGTPY